jgi:hypothetical protein
MMRADCKIRTFDTAFQIEHFQSRSSAFFAARRINARFRSFSRLAANACVGSAVRTDAIDVAAERSAQRTLREFHGARCKADSAAWASARTRTSLCPLANCERSGISSAF